MINVIKGIYKTIQKITLNIQKVINFSANNDNPSRGGKPPLPLLTPSAMIRFLYFFFITVNNQHLGLLLDIARTPQNQMIVGDADVNVVLQ